MPSYTEQISNLNNRMAVIMKRLASMEERESRFTALEEKHTADLQQMCASMEKIAKAIVGLQEANEHSPDLQVARAEDLSYDVVSTESVTDEVALGSQSTDDLVLCVETEEKLCGESEVVHINLVPREIGKVISTPSDGDIVNDGATILTRPPAKSNTLELTGLKLLNPLKRVPPDKFLERRICKQEVMEASPTLPGGDSYPDLERSGQISISEQISIRPQVASETVEVAVVESETLEAGSLPTVVVTSSPLSPLSAQGGVEPNQVIGQPIAIPMEVPNISIIDFSSLLVPNDAEISENENKFSISNYFPDLCLQRVCENASMVENNKPVMLLGRYEIGKLLGHGAFAKVYSARNVKNDQHVAIKVIDKEKILKGGLIAHIKREISILRRVRHPNIVQLFEVMATKSKIYFVMEYVRGGELFNKVAKGRLKEEVARKYFQQLISAVGFCHARGVFHRDLKPENLLLDENGDLKVSDFGLSAVSDQIRQDGLFHTFCGTPAYVAPEVLARKGYDAAKVDIWSCGVILFVLMAGYLPFHDHNVMAMYKRIYKGEFRCPKWFSPQLTHLMHRLMDTNPETRMKIPDIEEHRWFRKGFKKVRFYVEDDQVCSVQEGEQEMVYDDIESFSDQSISESDSDTGEGSRRRLSVSHRPVTLTAFDLISFSPGFDLSGLFEEGNEGSRFVTTAPVSNIITKLEEIGKTVSFTVRKKDCRVCLEGSKEGVKGPLTIGAEIFELTPSLVVVEIRKKGGDKCEYDEFYTRELKPGLDKLMLEISPASPPLLSKSVEEADSSLQTS